MKYKICIAFFITAFVWVNNCQGQRKIDTTVKIGKVGYRLICYNKETENNELDIKPIGFDNEAREHMVYIKGKMTRCEIDDLNSDGYPDVMVYTTSGGRAAYGNAYAIVAVTNKSFMPVGIPDVQL